MNERTVRLLSGVQHLADKGMGWDGMGSMWQSVADITWYVESIRD